jgi:hypothetical protein
LLNVKAADGLVRLARDMRQACLAKGYQEDYPGTPHLLQRAAGYWHPRLVPVLYEWGLADDHRTCDQALTYLQQITGLKYSREQAQDWLSWWRWAGPLVERRYDLADPAGVKAWLKAYVDADVAARRLLLRLWYFEPKVDEKALLIDSAGPHAAGARAALAELWLRGRLTAATRLALVQRFLRFELTELPPTPGNGPAWREVRIVARTDFSFPEDIWVHPRSAIALDGKPQLDDSWGSRQLGGDSHFGSLGSQRFGAPTARAVIEIREPRKDGGVAWIWRWEPKPLRLRDVGPEKPR